MNQHPLTKKASFIFFAMLFAGVCASNLRWSDPNCKTFSADGYKCLECAYHSYMDEDGCCHPVSDFCKTWDNCTGHCTSCFEGYGEPVDGVCSCNPVANDNNSCKHVNQGSSNKECESKKVKDADSKSKKADCDTVTKKNSCEKQSHKSSLKHCQEETSKKSVKQCDQKSSKKVEGHSQKSTKGEANSSKKVGDVDKKGKWSDPNCKTFSADGYKCLECAYHSYMDEDGCCHPVSDFCKTWDNCTGHCTSCFQGYGEPVDGVCSCNPVANDNNSCKHDNQSKKSSKSDGESSKKLQKDSVSKHKKDQDSKNSHKDANSKKSEKESHKSSAKSDHESRSKCEGQSSKKH